MMLRQSMIAPSVARVLERRRRPCSRRKFERPHVADDDLDALRAGRASARRRSSAGGTRRRRKSRAASRRPRSDDSIMCIASAAAVASSSSEALAIGQPVRSLTIVWKLSSASSRPCAISAW
jgi:hypothetical protein